MNNQAHTTSQNQQKPWPFAFSPVLAELDLFQLLGLETLQQDKKQKLFTELQENVWLDVLGNRIEKHLSKSDFEQLKNLTNNQSKPEAVLEFLSEKVQNLPAIMFEASVEYKKRYFTDYLTTLAKVTYSKLEKQQQSRKENKQLQTVQHQYSVIRHLLHYAEQDQWEKVRELLPEFNNPNK
ncbi:MAG: hypothetical protein WCP97_05890 [bacterium]